MQTLYAFKFTQQVLGNKHRPCTYLRRTIIAPHHLAAFTVWCSVPSIQGLDINDFGTLTIEVSKAPDANRC